MFLIKRATWFVIVFFLVAGLAGTVRAQSSDQLYVPETGHWIRGEFLKYYQSVDNSLLLFGYPITDEFIDSTDQIKTQYFQRARLDLIDGPTGQTVELAPLGVYSHETGAPTAPFSTNSPACREFDATGKSVCYAFLQFYDEYKGSQYFGNPISDAEIRDDRIVQYFERARMEWRPEMPAGQRVVLTDLGQLYFDSHVGDPGKLAPIQSDILQSMPLVTLQAHAFVNQALIPADGTQVLYIVTQDQNFAPVPGVLASVTVSLPNGQKVVYHPALTNSDGITQLTFSLKDIPVKDIVQVEVNAEYMGLQAKTSTWFRIWW
ncbi:MAG: hypothetical protein P4L50_21835 [Anaerolineaceae bacterium]|nr:hypothetical protein [Anaerolineaceae bacterium]